MWVVAFKLRWNQIITVLRCLKLWTCKAVCQELHLHLQELTLKCSFMAIRKRMLSSDSRYLVMLEMPSITKWTKGKLSLKVQWIASSTNYTFLNSGKEQTRSVRAQCKHWAKTASPQSWDKVTRTGIVFVLTNLLPAWLLLINYGWNGICLWFS